MAQASCQRVSSPSFSAYPPQERPWAEEGLGTAEAHGLAAVLELAAVPELVGAQVGQRQNVPPLVPPSVLSCSGLTLHLNKPGQPLRQRKDGGLGVHTAPKGT